jgi:hypothetical protein
MLRIKSMPSLFVIIPGYGKPYEDTKKEVLLSNINRIKETFQGKLHVRVCAYDNAECLPESDELEVVREPGLPGDFLKKQAHPDALVDYDYVLILFDDILLQQNVDITKMMEWKAYFNLDIISPTLTHDSQHVYKYMLSAVTYHHMRIGPCCELFCYLLDKDAYRRYYEHIDPDNNPWMWGLDLILHRHLGMKVGLLDHMNMTHLFQATSYVNHKSRSPVSGYAHVLKKYNEPNDDELRNQPIVFYSITQPSRI